MQGWPDNPYHALAQKYTPKGPGAVFTFGIKSKNPRQAGKEFIESLHIFSHLANVGDARSLVIHPASTTHQQLSDAELEAAGRDCRNDSFIYRIGNHRGFTMGPGSSLAGDVSLNSVLSEVGPSKYQDPAHHSLVF